MKQFQNQFIELKKKMNVFLTLKEGDKIYKDHDTDILYVDNYTNLQFLRRWWYGESREKTYIYIDTLFTHFIKYLDKILAFIRTHMFSDVIEKLSKQICEYILEIIEGLHNLKLTYPNEPKLVNKISAIIMTLLDFKKETSQFRVQKYKKPIIRSNSFDQLCI